MGIEKNLQVEELIIEESVPETKKVKVSKNAAVKGPPIDDYQITNFENNIAGQSEKERISWEEQENKYQEKLIDYLFKEGILEYKQGQLVCDIDTIKNITKEHIKKHSSLRSFYYEGRGYDLNWQKLLLDYFQDKKVYSKEDFANLEQGESKEEFKPKPLFYLPSKDQAFDIEKIKNAEFYLTLSDLTGKWERLNNFSQERFGYNAEESDLAVRIYHPQFGDGYRDENGRLMVKTKDDNEYKPISSDWLHSSSGLKKRLIKTGDRKLYLLTSPKEAILNKGYSTLRSAGLLTEDDFQHLETSFTEKIFRRESNIGRIGQIFIQGARYILGTEFENKKLVKLSGNLYGIVDNVKGYKKITHTFSPANPELIEQKKQVFKEKHGRDPGPADILVRKNEIDITPYKETDRNPKREDETPEQYAERIPVTIRNYNLLQKLSQDLAVEAQIGIHSLSVKEQAWLADYAYSMGDKYDQVLNFAKVYGLAGLKTFISCEYSSTNGDKILSVADRLEKNETQAIFNEYNQTLKQLESINKQVKPYFESQNRKELKQFPDQLQEALTRRTTDLFLAAHHLLETQPEEFDIKDIHLSLKAINKFLDILTDLHQGTKYEFNQEQENKAINKEGIKENSYQYFVKDKKTGKEYRLRSFVRPEHSSRGEARISFALAFEGDGLDYEDQTLKEFFNQEIEYKDRDVTKQKSEFTVRLDQDTVYEPPRVSLDLGRTPHDEGNLRRSGDPLGILLNSLQEFGSHNTESFDQIYAEPDLFSELANSLDSFLAGKSSGSLS